MKRYHQREKTERILADTFPSRKMTRGDLTLPVGEVVHPTMMNSCVGRQDRNLRGGWLLHLMLAVVMLGGQNWAWAQTPPASSEEHPESQHGYFDFETAPTLPEDSSAPPDSHLNTIPPADTSQSLDQPPKGLFRMITTAEGFEQDLDFRRSHLVYPVHPTDVFQTDALAVHVVFRVHKHYAAYQVIGRLFAEDVPGLNGSDWIDEDAIYLALEDESGYLKLFPPEGGWKPGQYRVEIYVGYEANPLTRMGTLRFTMKPAS